MKTSVIGQAFRYKHFHFISTLGHKFMESNSHNQQPVWLMLLQGGPDMQQVSIHAHSGMGSP